MKLADGIRVVSFDLDDTFWDCAPAIQRAERVLHDWLSQEAPATLELLNADPIPDRRERLLRARPELAGDVTCIRQTMLRELFVEAELEATLADRAFEIFYRARSEVQLYDGVIALLDALRPRFGVAAITNGNADLGLIGIDDRFDIVLKASLDQPAKPAPAMFDQAMTHFGIGAEAMVHVGDSGITDVAGAHAAGVAAVWFNPSDAPWPASARAPEYIVRSIDELSGLLLG